jgi:hypothetical protein
MTARKARRSLQVYLNSSAEGCVRDWPSPQEHGRCMREHELRSACDELALAGDVRDVPWLLRDRAAAYALRCRRRTWLYSQRNPAA